MCTRVLWNDNGVAVVVSRTMDWPTSTDPVLTVFPRGRERHGGHLGPVDLGLPNPARWTSRYASIGTTIYGLGGADGMNERGLAVHMLYLTACDFGERDPAIPVLHAGLWAQYLLDQTATVAEAVAATGTYALAMVEAHGQKATVHLALEDASGDSAIIEFVDGRPVVYHDRRHVVMTNDPPYDEQLALLAAQDFSHPSSEIPLPGNVNPRDRFQRASYYRALLTPPSTERQAVAGVLAIARNASVPFGAPYQGFGTYNTEYRTVCDLTNRRYFFELTTTPSVIWASLDDLALDAGGPVLGLDPDDITLAGNVADRFTEVAAPF